MPSHRDESGWLTVERMFEGLFGTPLIESVRGSGVHSEGVLPTNIDGWIARLLVVDRARQTCCFRRLPFVHNKVETSGKVPLIRWMAPSQ